MREIYKAYYKSDIGMLEVSGNDEGIMAVSFVDDDSIKETQKDDIHPSLIECINQLDMYFKGTLKEFSIKLNIKGTDFQKKVWTELLKIPYGKTASYKDIAKAVGNEKAVRAVGGANNKNNIAIIIPCHRVIGSDKSLTGYGGGLWRKEWLLKHEQSI